jgi:hypothetical protein
MENTYTDLMRNMSYYIKSSLKHLQGRINDVIDTQRRIAGLQKDIIRVKPHDSEMAKRYEGTLRGEENNLRGDKAGVFKLIQKIKVEIPESLEELGMNSFRITIISPQNQQERELIEQQKELLQLQKEFENLKREFERIDK